MKRYVWIAGIAVLAVLALGGCSGLLSAGGGSDAAVDLAMVAAGASDYRNDQVLAAMGDLEKQDLQDSSSSSRSLVETTVIRTLPDGTQVTIEKSWDDNDTPDNPEDDVITVTRTFEPWEGATWVETIVRRRRPTAQWTSWDENGEMVQTGTTTKTINGLTVRTGTLTVTWRLSDDGTVNVEEIHKETRGTGRDGAAVITRTTISYDEEGLQTKTRETYRMTVTESGGETDGEPVLVHSFTFQEITDPGYDPDHPDAVYTKITRDDGRYVIVRQKAEPANGIPRVSDHYDASGVLRATVSELRDRRTGVTSITRTTYVYDDGGNLVATHVHTGSMSYEFGDNSVTVTRQWDSGRRVVVTIEELSDGYRVTRDTPRGTIVYTVKFTDSGSVELYNENGVLIATVIVDDDGAWLVTYAGGETENGQLD